MTSSPVVVIPSVGTELTNVMGGKVFGIIHPRPFIVDAVNEDGTPAIVREGLSRYRVVSGTFEVVY